MSIQLRFLKRMLLF